MSRHRSIAWIGLLILMLTGGLLLRDRWLPSVGTWLDVGVSPNAADAVLILPGDENIRPFVAAALVRAGYAQRVLIPETGKSPSVRDGIVPATHELSRRVLLKRGLGEDQIIVLDSVGQSTFDDARSLQRHLGNQWNQRVLVVTNDYHTRRARWVFRQVFGEQSPEMSFISAPDDGFQIASWWKTEDGTRAVISEYLKFSFYAVRYGDGGYWLAGFTLFIIAIYWLRGVSHRRSAGQASRLSERLDIARGVAASRGDQQVVLKKGPDRTVCAPGQFCSGEFEDPSREALAIGSPESVTTKRSR